MSIQKKVCITAFGDKAIDSVKRFNVGDSVEVSVNVESREFNGKILHKRNRMEMG